jgi:hypothetical protein
MTIALQSGGGNAALGRIFVIPALFLPKCRKALRINLNRKEQMTMKNKWKRRRHPRPSRNPIRGNSRQMWKVQIQNMIAEEETKHGTGYGVSAPCAGGHGTAHAA